MWGEHNPGSRQIDVLADIQREHQAQMRDAARRAALLKPAPPNGSNSKGRKQRALVIAVTGVSLLVYVLAQVS
jgi:hypothetical protein